MEAGAVTERSAPALRSPVSWALLGLVIQRPSYGYELVQRFERTFGDTLELSSLSQIYTALDTLAGRALIEKIAKHDDDHDEMRQPKPHYRATAEGVRGYEQWLVEQIPAERRRSRLFARQLSVLPPHTALAIVERCERACLREAQDPLPADADCTDRAASDERQRADGPSLDDGGDLAARLLMEEGRLAVEARLAWLEYARRELTTIAGRRAAPAR
jgi:DNA-binding PadR family transcriptional regulator